MLKRIVWGAVILVIALAIAIPWRLYITKDAPSVVEETRTLQLSLIQQYGIEAKLINFTIPQKQYLVVWDDKEYRHVALWLDGIWAEILRIPIENSQSREP